MSKHTPGPWTVRDEPNELDDGGDEDVGSVAYLIESQKAGAFVAQRVYIEEDAHLLSAALELREAVESLLAAAPDAWSLPGAGMREKVMAARRALDKAAGRV